MLETLLSAGTYQILRTGVKKTGLLKKSRQKCLFFTVLVGYRDEAYVNNGVPEWFCQQGAYASVEFYIRGNIFR